MSVRDLATLLQAEPMRRVLGAGSAGDRPADLLALLGELIATGDSVLSAGRSILWLQDPEQGRLALAVPDGAGLRTLAPDDDPAERCLRSGREFAVADVHAEAGLRASADAVLGLRARSAFNLPLVDHDGEPLGVFQLLRPEPGAVSGRDERMARALAAQCQLLLQQSRLIGRLQQNLRLDEAIALARQIQMSTLPDTMPAVPGYDVHGRFLPAQRAGGDLFDLVVLDGRLFILLGDATGHGFGPALSATQMQAMLRVAFRCGAGLDDAYRHVNNQLAEDLPDDRFITAFMGFLDPDRHEVSYHSGGQAPILHFRAGHGHCEVRPPTNFPLGALAFDRAPASSRLRLEPGDVLVLLSDGIFEYLDVDGDPFGIAGVEEVLKRVKHEPAETMADEILAAVHAHGQGVSQADDITVVLVKRCMEESR